MPKSELTISLLGDVALNGLFCDQPEFNRDRFRSVVEVLDRTDLVFCNLETPLIGVGGKVNDSKKARGGVILNSTVRVYRGVLPLLNISAVSLANNHIYDCGLEGLKKTIGCLQGLGIEHTGAGFKKEHTDPVILGRNGIRIAFLAYVDRGTHPLIADDAPIHINYFSETEIIDRLERLKPVSDFTILSIHWGIDYSSFPTQHQMDCSRRLIDAGADIVMGHHPHTLQPFEQYDRRHIFYSLGGLCFGDFNFKGERRALGLKTKISMIPQLDTGGNMIRLVTTKELKGNRIVILEKDLRSKLRMNLKLARLKQRFDALRIALILKEVFYDRLVDFFFGYYRRPFSSGIIFKSIGKAYWVLRDYRRLKSVGNKQ